MRDTVFIYLQHLQAETCKCLKTNGRGEILVKEQSLPFNAIRKLQEKSQTIIILPFEHFSFHYLELPWLTGKKAQAAIPFALEEQLSENVEQLHVAFDAHYYQDKRYLVSVCRKRFLEQVLNLLHEQQIDFNRITVDWFALNLKEAAVMEQEVLINSHEFAGSLSTETLSLFWPKVASDITLLRFSDSNPDLLSTATAQTLEETSMQWLSQRLLQRPAFNLCQGQFANGKNAHLNYWYTAAAGMAVLWFVSLLLFNGLMIHQLNQKLAVVNNQIKTIYHQYFPKATQVVSPQFRITQLLKSQGGADNALWNILNQLTIVSNANKAVVEQVRYQNQKVRVNLSTPDFATLEKVQTQLQQGHFSVKQMEASTHDQRVWSTLEIGL